MKDHAQAIPTSWLMCPMKRDADEGHQMRGPDVGTAVS
jgi:hypothetical protein